MNYKHIVPALVLGLSLSSVAMARGSAGEGKRSHRPKVAKQQRAEKAKSKKTELR